MEWQFSLDNINEVAKKFWTYAGNARVIAFHGEMGSGKTTFIHALCDNKGVKDPVGSPTFSIINEYVFRENGILKMIYHIDLYRILNEEEAARSGVEDCLYSDHICLVEWPEKAPGLLPEETLHAHIKAITTETRKLQIPDN
jgi:tRNA threonylcarbamoyladenosine biosynthesis protein TsaE